MNGSEVMTVFVLSLESEVWTVISWLNRLEKEKVFFCIDIKDGTTDTGYFYAFKIFSNEKTLKEFLKKL